jgi:hypothetical protein
MLDSVVGGGWKSVNSKLFAFVGCCETRYLRCCRLMSVNCTGAGLAITYRERLDGVCVFQLFPGLVSHPFFFALTTPHCIEYLLNSAVCGRQARVPPEVWWVLNHRRHRALVQKKNILGFADGYPIMPGMRTSGRMVTKTPVVAPLPSDFITVVAATGALSRI